MSAPREPLHQPPDPADLARVPPASPTCARIRGLLRDYVDGDLIPADRAAVDEHIQACRTCAVALSRVEHEDLRLRRAFAGGELVAPRPGFAQRVVQRLVVDETSVLKRDALLAALPPRAAAKSAAPRGRRFVVGPVAWSLASVVLFAVVWLAVVRFDGDGSWLHDGARLVVTAADQTFDERHRRLVSGDGLGEDQALWVDDEGSACVDWHDRSRKAQPAATLQVRGGGAMRMESGAPVLVDGNVQVETRRPVSIPVADGSHIDLGVGSYVISAESAGLLPWPGDIAPDRAVPEKDKETLPLKVEVEVLAGDSAWLRHPMMGPALVATGQVGGYLGSSGFYVRQGAAGPAVGDVVSRVGGSNERPAEVPAALTGMVLERSGLPSIGTEVLVTFLQEGAHRSLVQVTGGDGRFRFETGSVCSSNFVVLQMVPSPERRELGLTAPDAYPLVHMGSEARLQAPVAVEVSEPMLGRIVDELGVPRVGTRVVPLVVDELFGGVLPWIEGQLVSDARGEFRLVRVPASLPHHQHLAVLLLHDQARPMVVPVPRGLVARLPLPPIVMQGRRTVRLAGLNANASFHLFEEVPGLPSGSAAVNHSVRTDSEGRVELLRVGSGRLWLRNTSPSHPMVRAMYLEQVQPVPTYRLREEPPRSLHSVFRPLQTIANTDLYLATSYRHERLVTGVASNSRQQSIAVVDGSSGRPAAWAQVFELAAPGLAGIAEPRFVGLSTGAGALVFDPDQVGGHLVAIGADGSLGCLDLQQAAGPQPLLALQLPGRVVVGPGVRAAVPVGAGLTIRFENGDLPAPGLWGTHDRFAAEITGWEVQVPPGSYRATCGGRSYQVDVPPGGVAILE
jgi:hypothetical protein